MTEFNADALDESQAEPVLVVGSLRYRGRLLSIEEWLPFYERQVTLERASEEDVKAKRPPDLRARVALWVDFLHALFPKRGRFSWFAPDPVEQLRKKRTALREAYYHFFYLQARALGWNLAGQATTDGESSSDSTPPSADALSGA